MFRMLRLVLAAMTDRELCQRDQRGRRRRMVDRARNRTIWIEAGGAQAVRLAIRGRSRPARRSPRARTAALCFGVAKRRWSSGRAPSCRLPRARAACSPPCSKQTGEIEFDVEKRHVKHFAVKTPFLAAVVKGTHFVVRAGADGDSVAVERGIVEVEALDARVRSVDLLPARGPRSPPMACSSSAVPSRADAGSGAARYGRGLAAG